MLLVLPFIFLNNNVYRLKKIACITTKFQRELFCIYFLPVIYAGPDQICTLAPGPFGAFNIGIFVADHNGR
jgi:hypothetical protein